MNKALNSLCIAAVTSTDILESIVHWAQSYYCGKYRTLDSKRLQALGDLGYKKIGSTSLFQLRSAISLIARGNSMPVEDVYKRSKLLSFQNFQNGSSADQQHNLTDRFLFNIFRFLSYEMLDIKQGDIVLRRDRLGKIQKWTGEFSIFQIWAFAVAVQCLESDIGDEILRELSPAQLKHLFRGSLLPLPFDLGLDRLKRSGLPEVHRHLNGSMLTGLLWHECLRNPRGIISKYKLNERFHYGPSSIQSLVLHIEAAQRLRCALLAVLSNELNCNRSSSDKHQKSWGDWTSEILNVLSNIRNANFVGAIKRKGRYDKYKVSQNDPASALEGSYPGAGISERAFLYHSFRIIAEPSYLPNEKAYEVFDAALHSYIIIQNLIRRELVQPRHRVEGLERFVENYAAGKVREFYETKDNIQHRLVQAYRTGYVHELELRISPSGDIKNKINNVIFAAHDRKTSCASSNKNDETEEIAFRSNNDLSSALEVCHEAEIPSVGFVFHFIRRGKNNNTDSALRLHRFAELRARNWIETQKLYNSLRDPSIGKYILGLDIAGNETSVPTEVFAPMIRYLRAASQQIIFDNQVKKFAGKRLLAPARPLKVTCHAGEDFHHILSGIRSVDEAIQYLGLQEGDRVGHALALGIEPKRWAENLGETTLVREGEWLDTLVWFFDKLNKIKGFHSIASEVERKIFSIAPRIYDDFGKGISIQDLYWAWCMRYVDPRLLRRKMHSLIGSSRLSVEEFLNLEYEKAVKHFGSKASEVYDEYQHNIGVRRRSAVVREVYIEHSWFDSIRAVQDHVLQILCDKRIAIEANPTSNLAISSMRDLREHPIFRWFPPGDSTKISPFVVVGTDDPGIFATELIHEYGFLAWAAEQNGASTCDIWNWLETLRDNGRLFSFFDQKKTSIQG